MCTSARSLLGLVLDICGAGILFNFAPPQPKLEVEESTLLWTEAAQKDRRAAEEQWTLYMRMPRFGFLSDKRQAVRDLQEGRLFEQIVAGCAGNSVIMTLAIVDMATNSSRTGWRSKWALNSSFAAFGLTAPPLSTIVD